MSVVIEDIEVRRRHAQASRSIASYLGGWRKPIQFNLRQSGTMSHGKRCTFIAEHE